MYFLTLLPALFLLATCSSPSTMNKSSDERSELVFGQYYLSRGGAHSDIFKLTNDAIYEDKRHEHPGTDSPYAGDYSAMADEKFKAIQKMTINLPQALLDTPDGNIGCPGCADGMSIYISTEVDGKQRFWLIDMGKSNIPKELHGLVDQIDKAVSILTE